jgi:hypothetical protein
MFDQIHTFRNGEAAGTIMNFDVYWGSYYRLSPIYAPFPLFRMQGFCEEPGTFALSLMPALFWLLIVEKAFVRAIIVSIGMLWTYSLGAFLGVILLAVLLAMVRPVRNGVVFFLLGLSVIFFLLFFHTTILSTLVESDIFTLGEVYRKYSEQGEVYRKYIEWSKNFIGERFTGEKSSFGVRVKGSLIALQYLKNHLLGTGTALGISTVNFSIANGFAIAVLESGLFGGLFYCFLFLLIAWLSLLTIFRPSDYLIESNMRIAVGLTVLTCLFMGLQRQ